MTKRPRRFAVHQPNFLPWVGYFVKIAASDTFVYLDDVQMPMGRSYVSRVAIKKGDDNQWLSVPVNRRSHDPINEVTLAETDWREQHLNVLADRYRSTPGFQDCIGLIRSAFSETHRLLADLNITLIEGICRMLDINTSRQLSSPLGITEKSDERIAIIGQRLGAEVYISGTGGNNYQSEDVYRKHGLSMVICRTSNERTAAILAPGARLDRSIIDIICVMGVEATAGMVRKLAVDAIEGSQ